MTYTYAILEISQSAFDEIKAKLETAGYQNQFVKTADGIEIDMHGIAVKAKKETHQNRAPRTRG